MPPYQKTPQKPLCSFYAINKTFDRVQMKETQIKKKFDGKLVNQHHNFTKSPSFKNFIF